MIQPRIPHIGLFFLFIFLGVSLGASLGVSLGALGGASGDAWGQEHQRSQVLSDVFVRLLFSDDGSSSHLTLLQKLDEVSSSPFWRMQLFSKGADSVTSTFLVNSQLVYDAFERTDNFLLHRLIPLLWGQKYWPEVGPARMEYFSQKLGVTLSEAEVQTISFFGQADPENIMTKNEIEMKCLISNPLKRWRSELLWVQRHTSWQSRSFHGLSDVEGLSGEFFAIQWGAKLTPDLSAFRLGFETSFLVAKNGKGSVNVFWTPDIYNVSRIANPVSVEIEELGQRQMLFAYHEKVTGPYIAKFHDVRLDGLRTMTLRFYNVERILIDSMTVSIDMAIGQLETYHGKEGGNDLSLHQVMNRQLIDPKSSLNQWLFEQRPDLRSNMFPREDVDFSVTGIDVKKNGDVEMIIQRFKTGTSVEWGRELRIFFDRDFFKKMLRRGIQDAKL